ncbi:MAG: BatA domain-containing protein [Flavobacteriales bacterium]|nr:BatA domain-containing protein [Flavobacteriales bacterium]
MSFVYPGFLFALAAISIPIIIHLFNFRKFRKVYFSDIRFLKNVEMQTRSRNQLRHLLVLAARILAVVCLVLAFAQPFIPAPDSKGASPFTQATIYVDNSFSMNAEGTDGSLLSEAKAKALEVAEGYANGSNLRLLTNDFDPRHQRSLSLQEFKAELAGIDQSPTVRSMSEVASRARASDEKTKGHDIFLITDLQRSMADIGNVTPDTLTGLFVLPVKATSVSNVYVDSAWFSTPVRLPGQPDMLLARIRNTGERPVENLTVKLTVNGMQRAIGTVTLQGSSFENVELAFTNPERGIQLAEVSIEDYPIVYDNRYLLSYSVARSIRILHVRGEDAGSAVPKLFTGDSAFTFTSTDARTVDFSSFAKQDLIVAEGIRNPSTGLMQELARFGQRGGHVLLIPTSKAEKGVQNDLLLSIGAENFGEWDSVAVKVDRVNLQSTLMRNVFLQWGERIDLPSVAAHFRTVNIAKSGREPLLTLADGTSFLSRYALGKGSTYVLTSPLNDRSTNFHRHALFVPALYNMALNSAGGSVSAEVLGTDRPIPITAPTDRLENLTLVSLESSERFKPEPVVRGDGTSMLVHGQVRSDGHCLLLSGQDTLQPVSFNYDRAESILDYMSEAEFRETANNAGITRLGFVSEKTGNITNSIREMQEGKRLWRLFLILALVFLGIEILLIRLFR